MGQTQTSMINDLNVVFIIPGADHGDRIYSYICDLIRPKVKSLYMIYETGVGLMDDGKFSTKSLYSKMRDADKIILCQVLVDYSKQDSWFAPDSPFALTLEHLKLYGLPSIYQGNMIGINLGVDFTSETPSTRERPDIAFTEFRCRVTRNHWWMGIIHVDETEFAEKLEKALLF